MDNMKAYADIGGRVFLSHYHNVWIEGETGVPTHAPAVWPDDRDVRHRRLPDAATGVIDQVNNPKGSSFATWMHERRGSTTPGTVDRSTSSRQTCTPLDPTKAERWVY